MMENYFRYHCGGWPGVWLRLAISGFCLGWAGWLLGKLGSKVGGWLFFFAEIPHAKIAQAEQATAWLLLLCALLVWLPGRWAAIAGVAGLLAFTDAVAGVISGGYAFSEWTVSAHALRWATPLAFSLWLLSPERRSWQRTASMIFLRIAVAAVFATHGLEALLRHPGFEDFLIGTLDNWLGISLTEEQILPVLIAIGVVDLGVAAAVLLRSWAWLFAWLALWGLVTALARLTTFGTIAWAELFLRFPHFCVPLALWSWSRSRSIHTQQNTPES